MFLDGKVGNCTVQLGTLLKKIWFYGLNYERTLDML